MSYESLPVVRIILELEFRSDGQWKTEEGEKAAALYSAKRFLRENNIEEEFRWEKSIRLICMEAGAVHGEVMGVDKEFGEVVTL